MEVTTAERVGERRTRQGALRTEPRAGVRGRRSIAWATTPAIVDRRRRRSRVSWNELRDQVARVAGGLASSASEGRHRRDDDQQPAASSSRSTWRRSRSAAFRSRSTRPPRPSRSSTSVSDAGAKIAIVEARLPRRLQRGARGAAEIEHVIVVDGEGGDHTLEELEEIDPDFDVARDRSTRSSPTTS